MNDRASSWRSPVVLTALAATLTLGLAACSGTDSGATTTPPSTSSSAVTSSAGSAGSESSGSASPSSEPTSSASSTSESSSAAPSSSSAAPSATSTSPAPSESRTSTSPTSTATTTATDGTGTAGPLLGAAALVLGAVPDSVVSSVETEQGGWEVKVIDKDGNEYEGRVNAAGTALVGTPAIKNEDAADRAKHRDRIDAATVDHQQAVGIIGRSTPGTITELGLDDYRGTTVWEADVQTSDGAKVSVKIDAAQGAEVTRSTG